MPGKDEEQKIDNNDDFVEIVGDAEEHPEDEQKTEDSDETSPESSEHDTEGKLGDEEAVMPDNEPPKQPGKFKRFFVGYWHKKKWTLPVTVLVLLAIIFAVPATRYPLLALGLKRSYDVTIVDSKTNTPVSGAKVMLDGKATTTDSKGKAMLTAKVGKRTLEITKQYYKDFSESVFVGVSMGHNGANVQLDATGRQVPIKVVNKITGKPVANAEVKVLDTEAKTDTNGMATIVLPTGSPTQSATISADGYNNLSASVEVTGKVVSANTFAITSSGRVYFLSNLSGNIDVVSTNLDGTDRKTVLAGTGTEDANDTVLLASRDWKYLALLSKRDGGPYTKLFLINTSNNQVTTMEEGSDTFSLVGWDNHYFVYQVNHQNVQSWQSGQSALKSYNADTGKLATLDQTTAQGKQALYINQDFGYSNTHIIGDKVLYVKEWGSDYLNQLLNGKKDQVLSVNPDGSGKQDLKDLSISPNMQYANVQTAAHRPQQIYIQFSTDSGTVEYIYENGNVTQSNTLTADDFNQTIPTYLQSPSGGQTFWAEERDGKNTLFVGDAEGDNGKQVTTLSDYTTYGWYTGNYLLVEKDGSELGIMSASGGNILKISDYFKPPQNFYGYGGGYGGL